MEIKFKSIDQNNWEECVLLKVNDIQKRFVSENWYSLLQSTFHGGLIPLAIYDREVMVGFLMCGTDEETERMEVCRLMIDKKYQNMGYGKAAMITLLDIIKSKYGSIDFYTSAEPENGHAIGLYEQLGFKKTGEIMWDEVVLKISL